MRLFKSRLGVTAGSRSNRPKICSRLRKIILVGPKHLREGYLFWTKLNAYGMVAVIDGFHFSQQPFFVLWSQEGEVFLNEFFGDLSLYLSNCAGPDVVGFSSNVCTNIPVELIASSIG